MDVQGRAAGIAALTSGDRARLAEAFGLLKQGHIAEAQAIAQQIAQVAPGSPDALHLLALCRKATGDTDGAVAAFEAALARAPTDANLLANYANLLSRSGRAGEAVGLHHRALALAPDRADGWMNLGIAQLAARDFAGARESLWHSVQLQPASAAAWQGLGSALRSLGDLAGAEEALRHSVALAPGQGAAWTNLGVVRRLRGDPQDALKCYAEARRAGFAGPELADAEASAHLDAGDPAQALAITRRLTASHPGYAAGQLMLAHLLWEHGAALAPDDDSLASLRAAVAAQPGNRELRDAYLHFLLEAGAADEALQFVRSQRRESDEPGLAAAEAQALEKTGDTAAACRLLAGAYPQLRTQPGFLNLHAQLLLKSGDAAAAAARALEALDLDPDNQLALAYLGVAWRLLSDSREEWLCGYERLIAEVDVEPPVGLEAVLTGLHTAGREPVNQSLRGGSQTSGALFGRRDAAIAATRDAMERAVLAHVGRLPDEPEHPFLRRRSRGIRFVGSWSVRLRSSGRHVNHIHQEGWMSSAYYVALPPAVVQADESESAGFIQFGEPPAELALGLGPRRIIKPRVGRLVLFPSYMWHGTVPFVDEAPRLTVAFDLVPSA